MQIRRNKPMPVSPKIIDRVKEALRQSNARFGELEVGKGTPMDILVPWDDFVFSTRKDAKGVYQPYLPPAFEKGLKELKKAFPKGVPLAVIATRKAGGTFAYAPTMSLESRVGDESTIVHEVLHFVQHVGDSVLRVGLGKLPAKSAFDLKARVKAMKAKEIATPIAFYGKPKKRSQTSSKEEYAAKETYQLIQMIGIAGEAMIQKLFQGHAAQNVEFYANAYSYGLDAANVVISISRFSSIRPEDVLHALVNVNYTRSLKGQPQSRQIDAVKAAYRIAADEINKRGVKLPLTVSTQMIPKELIENIKSGEELRRERREARAKQIGVTIPQRKPSTRTTPTPTPKPAAKPKPRPRRAAPTPAPTPARRAAAAKVKASGYEVRREVSALAGGRMAFVIYLEGKPTGKYFFSDEKAQAYCQKARR
jgi:hypothetical protein